MNNQTPNRVCNTKEQLMDLIMDVTARDCNLQIQQLICSYKRTGDPRYKIDAEALRAEFDDWWNEETAEFVTP